MASNRMLQVWRGLALALVLAAIGWASAPGREASAWDGGIIFVKRNANGANNGTSWANAFTSLQSALDAAAGGGYEIWVAGGTYTPFRTFPANPSDTFHLYNEVALYGGFAGTETHRAERRGSANVTILSGDWFYFGTHHRAYHVVTGSGTSPTAILDGFVVTGGSAQGSGWDNVGGGMFNIAGSPMVSNVTFSGNSATDGGGMYNRVGSNPILTNVTFTGNSAQYGGGMYNDTSNPSLTNVIFSGNSATQGGGGMTTYQSSPMLINVTMAGNSASSGGGIYYWDIMSPTIVNSILWGNTASSGSGAQIFILVSTPSVRYSDVQGGFPDVTNINADPRFVRNPSPGLDGTWGTGDDDYGDLHLRSGSPAIDAAYNYAIPSGVKSDRDGNPRIMGIRVDMGAYEAFPARVSLPLIVR